MDNYITAVIIPPHKTHAERATLHITTRLTELISKYAIEWINPRQLKPYFKTKRRHENAFIESPA